MNSAISIILRLKAAGATLWRNHGNIHFSAPRGVLTSEVLLSLRQKRAEILPLLPDGPDTASHTAQTPNIVRLDAGPAGRRVFCIHPIDGGIEAYFHLARELASRGVSTHGICAFDFTTRRYIPDRVPAIAARYVEQVKHLQKRGPYLLAGWSSGAIIALEMGCELARHHNEVAEVNLLDPPPVSDHTLAELPPAHRDFPGARTKSAWLWWRFMQLNIAADECRLATDFWSMDDSAKCRYLFENRDNPQVVRPGNALLAAHDSDDVLYMFHTVMIQFTALEDYEPARFPGAVNLFITIAENEPSTGIAHERLQHARSFWENKVGAIADLQWVPGNHMAVLRPPHVASVAGAIARDRS